MSYSDDELEEMAGKLAGVTPEQWLDAVRALPDDGRRRVLWHIGERAAADLENDPERVIALLVVIGGKFGIAPLDVSWIARTAVVPLG